MKRGLLNLLTAVSLLLCVAVCGLWVRSHQVSECINYQGRTKLYRALIHRGTLQLAQVDRNRGTFPVGFYHDRNPVGAGDTWRNIWNKPVGVHGGAGFGVVRGTYYRVLVLPLWLPVFVTAMVTAHWARRSRRVRELQRDGLCAVCGYDLRATPERCPECGTPAAAARP